MEIRRRKKKKRTAILIVCAVAVAALIAVTVLMLRIKDAVDSHGNVTVDSRSENAAEHTEDEWSDRKVYFAGFSDSSFNQKTRLELKNPKENRDFFIKFVVTDTDSKETLYESGLVESGKAVYWTPAEQLEAGIYNLAIQMMPYYSPDNGETWTQLTATSNRVAFTIVDSKE